MAKVSALRAERVEPQGSESPRHHLGPAEVIALSPEIVVRLSSGESVTARMALAVPYRPAIGDSLLVIGDGAGHYVIGVLRGSGQTVLELPGAVDLRAVGGPLSLSSDQAVRIDAPRIELRTTTLQTIAQAAVEQLGSLRQRVMDLVSMHAGQTHTVVDGAAMTQAKSSTLLTEEKVTINGRAVHLGSSMLPASNRGAGMNIGFPDVCNTIVGPATVPIPYPNFAMNIQAAPFSPTVKVSMMPALNMGSKIPMTMGDEPGFAHPTIKGMGQYTMGNPIIFIDGLPAINLLCPTTGNNMNNPLGAVLVPSAVNVFYCHATSESSRANTEGGVSFNADQLHELGEALDASVPAASATLLTGGVAHVAIHLFSAELPSAVHRSLEQLQALGASSVVLDLRDNPGGDLDALLRLASDFLDEGTVIARGVDADGDPVTYRARGGPAWSGPVVLLVNGATASAAEVFAGALRHHGRAAVIGQRTYGKGIAQAVRADRGGVLYGSALTLLLPDGNAIQGVGIAPDETVAEGEDPLMRAWLRVQTGAAGERR